jgi:hypothetical protein
METQLVVRDFEIGLEHGVKAPLLALVMQQHNRRKVQRLLAVATGAHLALQILHEPIREVICRAWSASGLRPVRPAVRTREFDQILLRVAVQRGPTCISDSYCIKRSTAHDATSLRLYDPI